MDVDERNLHKERLVSLVESRDAGLGELEVRIDSPLVNSVPVAGMDAGKTPTKSLLIVDERYLTETLRIIFQIVGYQVDTAHNGSQALRKALEKSYDLVIMEANLSDAGGLDLAQVMKNMNRKTKMVLMTGDEYWRDTLGGVSIDVDDILLKPFAPEELVNAVQRILEPRVEAIERKPRLPFA